MSPSKLSIGRTGQPSVAHSDGLLLQGDAEFTTTAVTTLDRPLPEKVLGVDTIHEIGWFRVTLYPLKFSNGENKAEKERQGND
jgi:hypothetical protein